MSDVEDANERIVASQSEERRRGRIEGEVAAAALDAEVHDDVAGGARGLAQVEASDAAVLVRGEYHVGAARDESNLHAHDVAELVRVRRPAREEGPGGAVVYVVVVEAEAAGPKGAPSGGAGVAAAPRGGLESPNEVDDAHVSVAGGGDAPAASRARHELRAEYVVVVSRVHGSEARERRADAPHAHAQVVAAGEQERRILAPRHGVDASGVPVQALDQAKVLDEVRVAQPGS